MVTPVAPVPLTANTLMRKTTMGKTIACKSKKDDIDIGPGTDSTERDDTGRD